MKSKKLIYPGFDHSIHFSKPERSKDWALESSTIWSTFKGPKENPVKETEKKKKTINQNSVVSQNQMKNKVSRTWKWWIVLNTGDEQSKMRTEHEADLTKWKLPLSYTGMVLVE